jgi:hypothetical protein
MDVAARRSTVHRIAGRVRASLRVDFDVLLTAGASPRTQPVRSVEQYWVQSVLLCAISESVPFAEAVRMVVSDALALARAELDGSKSTWPLEPAVVYDKLLLTNAYGALHGLRGEPDSSTLDRAAHILRHAILIADRAHPSNHLP